ncbi:MAG: TetR/AcrR family transcriptional regulator [Microthrixaceae bacterium]|jgi:AcrR family transcriptional regulator|nr:TetR/AcrR family transcriptional regulator [Microthrixaceae bacterium]
MVIEVAAPVVPGVEVAGAPPEPMTGGAGQLEERILDAAAGLVARWGVAKTSLGDVAKAAGCSRATLYRSFPGGKHDLFAAVGQREVSSYIQSVVEVVDEAEDLTDAMTRGLVVAARLLRDHDAAQFVLAHEPELVLPFLGFKRVDRLYAHVSVVIGPHLERFVTADRAAWLAEWGARLLITYMFNPDPDVDLVNVEDARGLVSTFVLPAFNHQAQSEALRLAHTLLAADG